MKTRIARQAGMTLLELMIALGISMIVSVAMVGVMANTMGTGTQQIRMTRLQNEMRAAMQLITRDLRRANFHSNVARCYADVNCNPDGSRIKTLQAQGTCIRYWFEEDADGVYHAGAFQLITRNSVNIVQLSHETDDACGNDWGRGHDVTNPAFVNVTDLTITDESFTEVISGEGDTLRIGKFALSMTAAPVRSMGGLDFSKTLQDRVVVRNHVLCPGGVCP